MEFKRAKDRIVSMDAEQGPLVELMKGFVVRVSLVDDGAYPQSSIQVRVGQMAAEFLHGLTGKLPSTAELRVE